MKVHIEIEPEISDPGYRKCDFCGQGNKRTCCSFVGKEVDICSPCARAAVKALSFKKKRGAKK
jgi:hypothetical protein